VEKRRRAPGRQLGRAAAKGSDRPPIIELLRSIGGHPAYAHIGREIETEPLLELNTRRPHDAA